MLVIKQCLKLLYSFCLSLKHGTMLSIRQCYQITRSVIVFDSIQVMNEPTFRQCSIIGSLPNHNMFLNMPSISSAWMFRHINTYIPPVTFCATTFPEGRVFSSIFGIFFSYIWAFPSLYCSTSPTSNSIVATWLATVNARLLMSLLPSTHMFHYILYPLYCQQCIKAFR